MAMAWILSGTVSGVNVDTCTRRFSVSQIAESTLPAGEVPGSHQVVVKPRCFNTTSSESTMRAAAAELGALRCHVTA
jgi:hypothetical protein